MPNNLTAQFNFTDPGANEDAEISATNNSNFESIEKLTSGIPGTDFMTMEHNINILDGSLGMFEPQSEIIPYFSNSLSNDNAVANNNIYLNFSKNHTIPGISFDFGSANHIAEMEISFNESNGLKSYNIYPDPSSSKYFFKQGSTNFDQISIKIKKTRFPNIYSRMQSIFLGFAITWTEEEILECTINESIHPISANLNINTCNITIYSENDEFNIAKSDNFTQYLSKYSEFFIFAEDSGNIINLGKYYLDTWDASHNNLISFNLISPLGLLDKSKYYEGGFTQPQRDSNNVWHAKTLYDLVTGLMDEYNKNGIIIPYQVSDSVKGTPLIGKTTLDTYRNVLQLICFCGNAAVDDTRDGIIKIYKYDDSDLRILDENILFENQNIQKIEPISKISIKIWRFDGSYGNRQFINLQSLELSSGQTFEYISDKVIAAFEYKLSNTDKWVTYDYGEYKVVFSRSGSYDFRVAFCDESSNTIIQELNNLNTTNDLSIDNAFLVTYYVNIDPANSYNVRGNLYEFQNNIMKYYTENKYILEFDFLNDYAIKTGQKLKIPLEIGGTFTGILIEQRIDASGGMISHAKMIGDIDES